MFKGFPIPLSPLEDQTEIVCRVESLFAWANRLEARYFEACTRVEHLAPATLAKAFRGELVPQNPNDEPAGARWKVSAHLAVGILKPELEPGGAKGPRPGATPEERTCLLNCP